jgi:hypothetical protein
MNYEVELDTAGGRDQTEEALLVTFKDGTKERMRLHEYTRVYAIPGLYEEVVQDRLRCATPAKLAELLVAHSSGAGIEPSELAVFDLGAGNGVVGDELRERGVETVLGSDNIAAARDAAIRDRPDLYEEYLVGDTDDLPEVPALVRERRLNGLVAAGALGLGHISAESFHRLWGLFGNGAWFAVSLHEDLVDPGASDFASYLEEFERRPEWGAIVARERYRHRLTMAGDPIHYIAVVAHKP